MNTKNKIHRAKGVSYINKLAYHISRKTISAKTANNIGYRIITYV